MMVQSALQPGIAGSEGFPLKRKFKNGYYAVVLLFTIKNRLDSKDMNFTNKKHFDGKK